MKVNFKSTSPIRQIPHRQIFQRSDSGNFRSNLTQDGLFHTKYPDLKTSQKHAPEKLITVNFQGRKTTKQICQFSLTLNPRNLANLNNREKHKKSQDKKSGNLILWKLSL